MTYKRSERGAYLIIMSFVMALLLGLGALVLDIGRLLILKTEMQNAVDAAALAAAKELDKTSGARCRAVAAAQSLLNRNSTFTNANPSLLTAASLNDANCLDQAGPFQFYCSIGYDFESSLGGTFCVLSDDDGDGKIEAQDDIDARYVKVSLSPEFALSHFEIDLLFLPVLRFFAVNSPVTSRLKTDALAGNSFLPCTIPPLAICNPFEDPTDPLANDFRNLMPEGGHLNIKVKANEVGNENLGPGKFSLLSPHPGIVDELTNDFGCTGSKNSATMIGCFLAVTLDESCTPPEFDLANGQKIGGTHRGFNTRFNEYDGWFSGTSGVFPPDENIREFRNSVTGSIYLDENTLDLGGGVDPDFQDRYGDGENWFIDDYWMNEHGIARPAGLAAEATRYETYLFEIANGYSTKPSSSEEGRRVINVAVLQCAALNNADVGNVFFSGGGFAKVFLMTKAEHQTTPGDKAVFIPAEYIGWELLEDSANETVVQLYE
jgi:Putative Flp pilus-assembly TadE/G-like